MAGSAWLSRLCCGYVAVVSRWPRSVLFVVIGSLVACITLALTQLQYRTQRDDLMSAHKECQQRWQRFVAEFGPDEDVVFVIEGSNRERMVLALDALAAALRAHTDQFDRVFEKVDLTGLRNRALLLLPTRQVAQIREHVASMGPLLGPLGPLAWRELNLQRLLEQARHVAQKQRAGATLSAADRGVLEQIGPIARAAALALVGESEPLPLWSGMLPDSSAVAADLLTQPRYFFSDDGTLGFLLARPAKSREQSFTPMAEAVGTARSIIGHIGPQFPELSFGLTGLPVLEHDEMAASDADTAAASWLALLGVGLLYFFTYKGLRYPLLTVSTLLTGTVWALGLATITVGYLTILSATFAVMLIGMGDYGVLWVARYRQERAHGRSVHEAIRQTAEHAGPSIAMAAATTALAFFATMLADFKAVAELGLIAGCGVLLCALACFTIVPAALVLFDRRDPAAATVYEPVVLPFPRHATNGKPVRILAVTAVLLLFSATSATGLRYDHNLLNMQSADLDSVRWERKLLERTTGASWHALSIADSPEQVLALKERFERVPEVSRVEEVASLVPVDQAERIVLLTELRDRLRWLPKAQAMPVGAADPLAQFEDRLRSELRDGLEQLRLVCGPGTIELNDLPAALRERFVSPDGHWLLRVYAREDLWDYDALARFASQISAIDAEATGKPFGTLEGLRAMKSGFLWAGVYALIAITFVLTLELRRWLAVGLVLLPLALGLIGTLGVLSAFGIPLNPANLVALPLIVGVGIENGVHVLHDYRERDRARTYRLNRATGRGILVAGLTTLLGFGALLISRHQGLFGLSLTLTLGVGFCMIASLLVLPALLTMREQRKKERSGENRSAVSQRAAA